MSDGKVLPNQEAWGIAYSIVGLSMTVLSMIFFKHHARFLDYLQLCFFWSSYITTTNPQRSFSSFLDYSWLEFIPSFYEIDNTTYTINSGNLLSVITVLVGLYIIVFLLYPRFDDYRIKNTFGVIYHILQGLLKWVYFPLVAESIFFIVDFAHDPNSQQGGGLAGSIIVLAFLIIFVAINLACVSQPWSQPDDIQLEKISLNKKYEGWSYVRAYPVAFLVIIAPHQRTEIPLYVLVGFLAVNMIYPLYIQIRVSKILKGIWVFLGEAVIITILSLIIWKNDAIVDYNLDFFLLSFVLFIEIVYYIIKFSQKIHKFCNQPPRFAADANPEQLYTNVKIKSQYAIGETEANIKQQPVGRQPQEFLHEPKDQPYFQSVKPSW